MADGRSEFLEIEPTMTRRRSAWTVFLLLLGIAALSICHLLFGSVAVPWRGVVDTLQGGHGLHATIIKSIRGPRVLTAAGAGGGLALTGLLMQTFFRNPLAGPSVLGVTSGASMGVALFVLGGHWLGGAMGLSGLMTSAIAGSMGILAVILAVASRHGGVVKLLVFGLMLSYAVGALVTVMQAEARASALQEFVFWGMGTFGNGSAAAGAGLLLGACILGVLASGQTRALDAWTLGARTAESMGIDARPLRWGLLGVTGLLTGVTTAICGPVAFLGLAAPHVVRLLHHGRSHRTLVPLTLLTGALLGLAADLIVRAPWAEDGGGWPLNAVLSLMGAPMVLYVLMKRTWHD